jgi:hypothetical protein
MWVSAQRPRLTVYGELSVVLCLEFPIAGGLVQPHQHVQYDSSRLRLVGFPAIVCWDCAFGLMHRLLTLLFPEPAQTSERAD